MAHPPDPGARAPQPQNRALLAGVVLNGVLLAMIAYGFWQSEHWRWAWALVAIPIIIVTLTFLRHLRSER